MRKALPLVAALLALGIWFYSGYSLMNFVMAETPQHAASAGREMPAAWSAGVWSHGRYIEWYTIRDRPGLFALACLGLLSPIVVGGLLGKKVLEDWKHLVPPDVQERITRKK